MNYHNDQPLIHGIVRCVQTHMEMNLRSEGTAALLCLTLAKRSHETNETAKKNHAYTHASGS